jgi:hypothetical protein
MPAIEIELEEQPAQLANRILSAADSFISGA